MILVLVIVGLFIIASVHIYMYERLCNIVEFKKAVKKRDYGLYRSLLPSNVMLYTFWDWQFHKMIRPHFYKMTGRTKTETLKDLQYIYDDCNRKWRKIWTSWTQPWHSRVLLGVLWKAKEWEYKTYINVGIILLTKT